MRSTNERRRKRWAAHRVGPGAVGGAGSWRRDRAVGFARQRVAGEEGRAEAQPVLTGHVDAGQAAAHAVVAVEVGPGTDEQPVLLRQLAECFPVVFRELLVCRLEAVQPDGLEAHDQVLEPFEVGLVHEWVGEEGAPTGLDGGARWRPPWPGCRWGRAERVRRWRRPRAGGCRPCAASRRCC